MPCSRRGTFVLRLAWTKPDPLTIRRAAAIGPAVPKSHRSNFCMSPSTWRLKAREELEYAEESKDTTYFDEDAAGAKEAVEGALRRDELLSSNYVAQLRSGRAGRMV